LEEEKKLELELIEEEVVSEEEEEEVDSNSVSSSNNKNNNQILTFPFKIISTHEGSHRSPNETFNIQDGEEEGEGDGEGEGDILDKEEENLPIPPPPPLIIQLAEQPEPPPPSQVPSDPPQPPLITSPAITKTASAIAASVAMASFRALSPLPKKKNSLFSMSSSSLWFRFESTSYNTRGRYCTF